MWDGLSASLKCRAQGFWWVATPSLDGGLGTQAAYCLTHCSSLSFPPMQIPCTAVQSTQAQQWPVAMLLSRCHSPTQCLSMVRHWAWQGMQTPWRGISTAPIVWGQCGAGFGCMAIQWLYFYSLALDRDAQWPHFSSAAVSECVRVMPPAEALIISVDMTRKGAMVDSVIAVCCPTCRLGRFFFNGLGRGLLLMYNLLLILLTLKGEHVDRDLT